MTFELKNIQSIEHVVYDFPDRGIVQIWGGNSNGKSILFKAINAVVTMSMVRESKRRSLIRRGTEMGEILMTNDGKSLYVLLHRERNLCKVLFQDKDGTEVIRTFRDGGIEKLIESFGFLCYSKNSICLQLCETFGPRPFVNTTDVENGEIVASAVEDSVAKKFLESFKTFTYPKATDQKKQLEAHIERLQRTKQSIVVYNWAEYERRLVTLREYYEVLKNVKVFELQLVNVPLKVQHIEVDNYQLDYVNVPPKFNVIDISPFQLVTPRVCMHLEFFQLENISELVTNMEKLREGICPTCGRSLIER